MSFSRVFVSCGGSEVGVCIEALSSRLHKPQNFSHNRLLIISIYFNGHLFSNSIKLHSEDILSSSCVLHRINILYTFVSSIIRPRQSNKELFQQNTGLNWDIWELWYQHTVILPHLCPTGDHQPVKTQCIFLLMTKRQTQSLLIIMNQAHRGVEFQICSFSKHWSLIHNVNTQEANWATKPAVWGPCLDTWQPRHNQGSTGKVFHCFLVFSLLELHSQTNKTRLSSNNFQ